MAKKPVAEFRVSNVKALVWANSTSAGLRHNVTLTRIYKDGQQWKESASFGVHQLPLAQIVLQRALEWIYEQGSQATSSEQEPSGEAAA